MLALVGLTSVGGYLIGLMWFRLSGKALRPALGKMLECVGATLLFAVLNVALATALILAMRSLTGRFVTVYVVNDATWLALSLLQGLTFQWWRELAGSPQRERGR